MPGPAKVRKQGGFFAPPPCEGFYVAPLPPKFFVRDEELFKSYRLKLYKMRLLRTQPVLYSYYFPSENPFIIPQGARISLNHKLDVTPKVESLLDSIKDGLLGAAKKVEEGACTAAQAATSFSSAISDSLTGVTKFLWTAGVCCAVVYIATKIPKILSIILSVLSFIVPKPIQRLLNSIVNRNRAQAFDFTGSTAIGVLITSILSFSIFGKGWKHLHKQLFSASFIKDLPRFMVTWDSLYNAFSTSITAVINRVRAFFKAGPIKARQTKIDEVNDWCHRVIIAQADYQIRTDFPPHWVESMMCLRREGAGYEQLYRFSKDVNLVIVRYRATLDEIFRRCSPLVAAARGPRVEPVGICLVGQAGIGKTFLVNYLLTRIMAQHFTPEERAAKEPLNSQIYSNQGSKFWNGYNGETCAVWDDAFQSTTVPGDRDNDFHDIIRAINGWGYPLDMADIESKGNTFFTSKIVMCTTNSANITRELNSCIICPTAVTRRLPFTYKLVVTREWCRQGKTPDDVSCLDIERVTEYARVHKDIPWSAWSVHQHNLLTGETSEYVQTLDSFVDLIVRKLDSHVTMTESNSTVGTAIAEKYRRQALEILPQVDEAEDFPAPDPDSDSDDDDPPVDTTTVVDGVRSFDIEHPPAPGVPRLKRWYLKVLYTARETEEKYLSKFPLLQLLIGLATVAFVVAPIVKFIFQTLANFFNNFTKSRARRHGALKTKRSVMLSQSNVIPHPIGKMHVPAPDKNLVAQADKVTFDIGRVVQANVYSINLPSNIQNGMRIGFLTMVSGHIAMMPYHFNETFDEITEAHGNISLTLSRVSGSMRTYQVPVSDLHIMHSTDFSCPYRDFFFRRIPTMCAHANIAHFFVEPVDVNRRSPFLCRLQRCFPDKEGNIQLYETVMGRAVEDLRYDVGISTRTIQGAIRYEIPTRTGDCGAPLFLADSPFTECRKLMGFHIAGNEQDVGFSTIITAETIRQAVKHYDCIVEAPLKDEHIVAQCSDVYCGLDALYTVAPKRHYNTFSNLQKTPIYNLFGGYDKIPARLCPFKDEHGNMIDPMAISVAKYAGPVHMFNNKELDSAAYVAFEPLRKLTRDHTRQLYTFEEAVIGVPSDGITGVPRVTSPGYPYVLEGITNKKYFFGSDPDYDLTRPEALALKDRVTQIIEDAKQNKRNLLPYVNFLKDEARDKKKVKEGKTRLIAASSVDYTIAFRMYFLAFSNAVQKTKIDNGIGVGMNPYSDWHVLKRALRTRGTNIVAGDYSGYDSSLQPQVFDKVLSFINTWYNDSEENKRVRRVLWMEVTHSRHLGGVDGCTIYQWVRALPSGHPMTSIINSCYQLIILVLVFRRATGSLDFWEHVYVCVYGDDNILSIDDSVIGLFNQVTITAHMADIHMVYTGEAKGDEVLPPFRDLTEVSFLKRGFPEDGLHHAACPVELSSILGSLYWLRTKRFQEEILEDSFNNALAELSMHAVSIWDTHVPVLVKTFAETWNIHPKYNPTRLEYRQFIAGRPNPWG
jgi:hypothetical protein